MISLQTWEKTTEDHIRQIADFLAKPDRTEHNTNAFLERLTRAMQDALRQSRQ